MFSDSKWALATVVAVAMFAAAMAADRFGTFVRPSTGTAVDFYDCGGKLCGKIVGVKDPSRSKEIGTVILKNAAKMENNVWKGSLLNTDDGKTYSGVVELQGARLSLKGCVMMVCQGETWQRLE
jgi:uncharacterized protein (DUF2147 family)